MHLPHHLPGPVRGGVAPEVEEAGVEGGGVGVRQEEGIGRGRSRS